MHVSRKADYAVRAMSYLAHHRGRRVLIDELAQTMAIPRAFLSKIMKELVRGGVVRSQTGPGGGYEIARAPEDITFRQVMEIVEGPWNLVPCQSDDGDDSCLLHGACTQVGVWDEIRMKMLAILSDYTLDQVKTAGLNAGEPVIVPISGAAG